ncbi:MAG: VWA domain-containing protein [Clostridia bacterium]|nr:VWA domain-containing protein [Clostridia bacterium]
MKKLLSALIAVVIVLSTLISLPLSVSAESLYIRKIVSVVYDDSGSMDGENKWAFANYAMQSFCGMLNSEDQLYITYMADAEDAHYVGYDPQRIDLSAGGIQTSVEAIRTHNNKGNTPYQAVEIAYNKLKSIDDPNPNTQYWLVVITDGEFQSAPADLNAEFDKYVATVMPNGSYPQVTFLGIGKNVTPPKGDQKKGIYTYSASNASGIIGAMSDMADRISGRTRLDKNGIKKIDDTTIQVSSSIPLLNIAVFTQGGDAKITKAEYTGGANIPISRNVSLNYPGYSDLVGGAYLLGDSQTVIEAGSYNIKFDHKVDIDNVIVLFEPALEMRVNLAVNGKEITDFSGLSNSMENDKITISCKIYEMGTSKEVDPALLPPGTKFEITVTENGTVAEQISGKDMVLADYVLKNTETEIEAAVLIEGFNPITFSTKFTPVKYVPKIVYTVASDFGSDVKNVKLDYIDGNKDLSICFTFFADGVPMTDTEAVKALNPVISVSPQGNAGVITYSNDGKVIFTPNAASIPAQNDGSFEVDVTCTIDEGASATQTYTVLISSYEVISVAATQSVKKTELFGNPVSVSFYITKDGDKLDKAAVEKQISILLNEEHASLKTDIVVSADGTITVTPYTDEEYILNFKTWWTNWSYYFGLEGSDIKVTLNHAYGNAESVIDIVGEDTEYMLKNVYAPLILEILIVAAILAYIIRYFTKPRFASNGVLYVGSISWNRGTAGTHRMELGEVPLKQFNKFKNLWNPFKPLIVSANGVSITAVKGNRIQCNELFPWFSDGIRPKVRTIQINSPKDVVNYCLEKEELVIHEIKTISVMDEQNRIISQDDSVYYFARADIVNVKVGTKQTEVIDSAIAFCYSTIQN